MKELKTVVVVVFSLMIFAFAENIHPEKTISGLIAEKQDLSLLNEALNTAELVDMLKEEGPYTVFAPTNEGFKSLPDGRLDEVLNSEDKTELQDMLKYHIVADEIRLADLEGEQLFETLEGSQIKIINGGITTEQVDREDADRQEEEEEGGTESSGSKARVNNAHMVEVDIKAENGILHIIDAVVLPSDIDVMGASDSE